MPPPTSPLTRGLIACPHPRPHDDHDRCLGTGWVAPHGCTGVPAGRPDGLGLSHTGQPSDSCPVHPDNLDPPGPRRTAPANIGRSGPPDIVGARPTRAAPDDPEAGIEPTLLPVLLPIDDAERIADGSLTATPAVRAAVTEALDRAASDDLAAVDEADPVAEFVHDLHAHRDVVAGNVFHVYDSALEGTHRRGGRRVEVIVRLAVGEETPPLDVARLVGDTVRVVPDRALVEATLHGPCIPDEVTAPLDPSIAASLDTQVVAFLRAIAAVGPPDATDEEAALVALSHVYGSLARVGHATLATVRERATEPAS